LFNFKAGNKKEKTHRQNCSAACIFSFFPDFGHLLCIAVQVLLTFSCSKIIFVVQAGKP
jgi:hypothetical protein